MANNCGMTMSTQSISWVLGISCLLRDGCSSYSYTHCFILHHVIINAVYLPIGASAYQSHITCIYSHHQL